MSLCLPGGLYGGMVCQGDTCLPGRTSLPPEPSRPASLFPRRGGGVYCSSLKNGVFLTVPEGRNSANATGTPHAATASAAFVRQVAKGGRIPAFRGSKKYLRFFQWSRKHPHPAWEKGRLAAAVPEGRNPAALSDLSDERSRRSRCVRSSGRVGRIPAFRDS